MTTVLPTIEQERSLLPCPFCGSRDIECINTHTAFYWCECCDCGAEVPGRSCEPQHGKTTKKHYERAIVAAIAAWNRRTR